MSRHPLDPDPLDGRSSFSPNRKPTRDNPLGNPLEMIPAPVPKRSRLLAPLALGGLLVTVLMAAMLGTPFTTSGQDGIIDPPSGLVVLPSSAPLEQPFFAVATPTPTPSVSVAPENGAVGRPVPSLAAGLTTAGGDLISCVAVAGGVPQVDTQTAARLDGLFASGISRLEAPAISAAVRFRDGSVWTRASGFVSIESQTPATTETAFAFASAGKPAIAAIILRLVEEGHLKISTRVRDLLPEARIDPTATVGDLLAHRSGLGDYLDAWPTEAAMSRDATIKLVADDLLDNGGAYKKPGEFYYSNTGYVLLSRIVDLYGTPWNELLHSEILDPVGACTASVPSYEGLRTAVARGYGRGASGWYPLNRNSFGVGMSVLSASDAAGGMVGTSADLARLTASAFGLALSRETIAANVSAYAGVYGRLGTRYGISGRVVYGHGGRLGGARTQTLYDAQSGISVAVCLSYGDGEPLGAAVALLRAALAANGPAN